MNKDIKLFLVDCDGVLTDGGMYYSESGNESKKFNTRDGMAFKLLRDKGVLIGIISGESNSIIEKRSKKLKLDYLFMGITDKLKTVDGLRKKLGLKWDNILYIGDDINDLSLLKKVGTSACPKDAEDEVLRVCEYVSDKAGGCGVVRDVYNKYYSHDTSVYNKALTLFSIPNMHVYVDTFAFFKHCMKNNYFNAHIMVKMLAIDCYYGKNDFGWKWYNEMQKTRVKDNPLIPKHMANHEEEFKKLIVSFEKNGYLLDYPIVVNKDFIFIDGSHRLALALYFGIEKVPITIDNDYFDIDIKDYSFEWFANHGMKYIEKEAMIKYNEIYKKWGDQYK